jgi:hypothetical protein
MKCPTCPASTLDDDDDDRRYSDRGYDPRCSGEETIGHHCSVSSLTAESLVVSADWTMR